VQQGTTLDQQVVSATLADLDAQVADAGLHSPCLIIVGEVVRLRDELDWFDTLRAAALPEAQAALEAALSG
jgi:siroheme synthase